MRYAIVGSRDYDDMREVTYFIDKLPLDAVIVSGGARGVDRVAVEHAQRRGMETKVYPARWRVDGVYNPGAGFERNQEIIEDCDVVVAFWDGRSRGTLDTLTKARAAGRPIICTRPF